MKQEETGKGALIVTGDVGIDRFVYLEELPKKPANLRETWVDARRFWTVTLDASSGSLIQYLRASGVAADDPCRVSGSLAESIYILTRRKDERGQRWCIAQAIVSGERTHPSGSLCAIEGNTPAAIVDFNQGWVKRNEAGLAALLGNRPYVIRTHDPRKPEWTKVREQGIATGLWFSPIQDMADGSLWFHGNWESIYDRLVGHLRADGTLWANGRWLHYVVVQVSYDGALVLGPGLPEKGELLIFKGDQPGSFLREDYGTVVAGGIVFMYSLISSILGPAPFEPGTVVECARKGLSRVRQMVREGYVGPQEDGPGWELPSTTNLPVKSLEDIDTSSVISYTMSPPPATWETACDVVCGTEDTFLGKTSFRLGHLTTASPVYADTLLRLTGNLQAHVSKAKGVFSFCVFGGPGSGKSFVAEQIARAVDPGNQTFEQRTFNLSQFQEPVQLIGAFKQVQTMSLSGKVPFVLWDEFDAYHRGERAGWLPSFLMPMQDASYFDGLNPVPLGKCVFVFIGGTFRDQDEFGAWASSENGRLLKGTDFHSRLSSTLTVPSADFKDGEALSWKSDDEARLVRALLIRFLLKKEKGVSKVAQEVLAYLLHVPLRHGVRSLQMILSNSELGRASYYQTFHLPHLNVLRLHVDDSKMASACRVTDFLKEIGFEPKSPEQPMELKWR